MEFWNDIINTAMIGTDKKSVSVNDLPVALQQAAAFIYANNTIDKDEQFLQLAAVCFNYRQAGILPLHKETITLAQCPTEEKLYCNNAAMQVLKDIFLEESTSLLKYWLQQCDAKRQVAHPQIIPSLLMQGVQQKKLQSLIASCCGKRGEWLSRFNEAWNFSQNQTAEQLWQTGTPEQRKTIFKETRIAEPAVAAAWLQQAWPQEDANTKIGFLEIFSISVNETDIPFLTSLATEKSKKVKDEAVNLLKQIASSDIVQLYQQALQQSVELKKEKTLLGLSSKMMLQFHLPLSIDESIFKTGIEKLSNNKYFSDDEFIIFQLIQAVPPVFWEKQFAMDAGTIIDLFQKNSIGKKLAPALAAAAIQFKTAGWAVQLIEQDEDFYAGLLPLLPLPQQEKYSNKFFEKHTESIIQYAVQREAEWSNELTTNILRHVAKNPYHYHRSFFNHHIQLIPASIIIGLQKIVLTDEGLQVMWNNTSDYIIKLISLKTKVLKAFNE